MNFVLLLLRLCWLWVITLAEMLGRSKCLLLTCTTLQKNNDFHLGAQKAINLSSQNVITRCWVLRHLHSDLNIILFGTWTWCDMHINMIFNIFQNYWAMWAYWNNPTIHNFDNYRLWVRIMFLSSRKKKALQNDAHCISDDDIHACDSTPSVHGVSWTNSSALL